MTSHWSTLKDAIGAVVARFFFPNSHMYKKRGKHTIRKVPTMLLFMGDHNDLLQLLNKVIDFFIFLLAFLGLTCGEGLKNVLRERQTTLSCGFISVRESCCSGFESLMWLQRMRGGWMVPRSGT